jgi:hypothetical protein
MCACVCDRRREKYKTKSERNVTAYNVPCPQVLKPKIAQSFQTLNLR